MAFNKIEDFFVSEINAVVEISAPKHIIVRKNVSSLSHKKKKADSAHCKEGGRREKNKLTVQMIADVVFLKCYLRRKVC